MIKDKYYAIRRFVLDIPYNLRKVKWFFQRGKRGWADCDTWNIDEYLAGIIAPMLKHLKSYQHSYPGVIGASSPEEWGARLDEMIEGFEAASRVLEDDYFQKPNSDILTRRRASKRDQRIFKKGANVFIKWYFNLWD